MKLRIAIIAACAGTLILAQVDVAQAIISTTRSNIKHPSKTANPDAANSTLPSAVNTSRSNIKYPSKTATLPKKKPHTSDDSGEAGISDQAAGGTLSSYKNKK